MAKKNQSIPTHTIAAEFTEGIAIGKVSVTGMHTYKDIDRSHRDSYHSFFIQEKGSTTVEIDFQTYTTQPLTVAYIHPGQVHRMIRFEDATLSFCMINRENLNPEYLNLLNGITHAKPLQLVKESFALIAEAVELSVKLFENGQGRLYGPILKDSCNTIVGLITSQYINHSNPSRPLSRFEVITKAFKSALELGFTITKRPTAYARKLNISTPYLNECVKNTTGLPVSNHIQQRVILEAKRLLYHTELSVKEISSTLGYDDYAYFSRLFTKTTGMTPLAFRRKNLD